MKKAFYVLLAFSLCLFVLNQFQIINLYEYFNAFIVKFPLVGEKLDLVINHFNDFITTTINVFTTWDASSSFFANLGEKLSGLFIEPYKLLFLMISDLFGMLQAVFDTIGVILGGAN